MPRILLTGMSATGKSTLIAALAALGHRAIDTDDGWSVTAPDGEWVWNEPLVEQLLDEDDGEVLFVGGCASNQRRFRDRFDHVVLLSAPLDVMLERLETRTTNGFGKLDDERARILDDLAHVEPLIRASATAEIRTDRPLPQVINDVLRLVG